MIDELTRAYLVTEIVDVGQRHTHIMEQIVKSNNTKHASFELKLMRHMLNSAEDGR